MLIKFAVKRECTVLLRVYIVANLVELNKFQSFENVVEARACFKASAQYLPPGTNIKKCHFKDVSSVFWLLLQPEKSC